MEMKNSPDLRPFPNDTALDGSVTVERNAQHWQTTEKEAWERMEDEGWLRAGYDGRDQETYLPPRS